MTTLAYRYDASVRKQNIRLRDDVSTHWGVLTTCSAVGLALTALMFVLGFGEELVWALAAAG